jgi:hypothetical protein
VRRPGRAFGWLDARLLHDGWLSRLGPESAAVLSFLALAADRQGASFYGRGRMCSLLGIDREALDRALSRLLELGLVAHRPWRANDPDGVWQLLPLPAPAKRGGEATAVSDLLAGLGLKRSSPRGAE